MQFSLTILGTSAAIPTAERFCSAQLLQVGGQSILIDCGEGTQMQLQKIRVGFSQIKLILISHLHADHYLGLPGLLSSWALLGRTQALHIISPPGLQEKIVPWLESVGQVPFAIRFKERSPVGCEEVWSDGQVSVYAFPLVHRIPTNAYLIREKERQPSMRTEAITQYAIPYTAVPAIKAGADFVSSSGQLILNAELVFPALPSRSFAYCSDTRCELGIVPYIAGVDILYHEATFLQADVENAIKTQHTTALEAGQIAAAAGVKTLVIGHFSARYGEVQQLEAEARKAFPKTYAARELMCIEVPYQRRER